MLKLSCQFSDISASKIEHQGLCSVGEWVSHIIRWVGLPPRDRTAPPHLISNLVQLNLLKILYFIISLEYWTKHIINLKTITCLNDITF